MNIWTNIMHGMNTLAFGYGLLLTGMVVFIYATRPRAINWWNEAITSNKYGRRINHG